MGLKNELDNDTTIVFWNVYGIDNAGRINYSDNSWNFYLKDHLGSVRCVIDGNGEIISAEDLDMWGYRMADRSFQSDTTFYKYTGKERDVTTGYDYFGARYYDSRIGRWGQVEPLINKYPQYSSYCYTLNNPIILTDPTGLWVAEFDGQNNRINVIAEKGDNLQTLYSQLGISADDFAKTYDINLDNFNVVAGETSFDITNFVISNTNFEASFDGSNCHGFVNVAKFSDMETQVNGLDLTALLGNVTNTPVSGSIAIFSFNKDFVTEITNPFTNVKEKYTWAKKGDPQHSAIFIIKNAKGEPQYLNRLNTGHKVSVTTLSGILKYFHEQSLKFYKETNIQIPDLDKTPKYYE